MVDLIVFGLVVLPILVAVAEVVLGAMQAHAGLRRRSFHRLAWGGSLALVGLACIAGALWYYLDRKHLGGLASIWILGLWYGPAVIIPAGTLILGCLVTVLGASRRSALEARGFRELPTPAIRRAALAVVVVSLVAFLQVVAVPEAISTWQRWPYRTLMASDQRGTITLWGRPVFKEYRDKEAICVIRTDWHGPWRARISLELDPEGRIVATTRKVGDSLSRREHLLPFEKSEYVLEDGRLERIR